MAAPLALDRRIMLRLLRLFGCLVLMVGLASAQAPDPDRLAAVKEFQKQFKKFKTEPEQVEAVMTLRKQDCVPAVAELFKLTSHKSAAVQQAALKVLGSYTEAQAFQPWIEALPTSKDQGERALVLKVLGAAGIQAAEPAVVAAAMDPKAPPPVRYEAMRAPPRSGR